MIDWAQTGWWDLPGPSRFIHRATREVLSAENRVILLRLPNPEPDGLLEELHKNLDRQSSADIYLVDAGSGLRNRSPTAMLAIAGGATLGRIKSIGEFVDDPMLSRSIFIIKDIPAADWQLWSYFFEHYRRELMERPRITAPAFIIAVPVEIAPDRIKAVHGKHLKWEGRIARTDTQLYVERLLGWPGDTLADRTAVSVLVEMSGWDPTLADAFATLTRKQMLAPAEFLVDLPDMLMGKAPTWQSGHVDLWDGAAWVHTAVLAKAGRQIELDGRLWRGQVRTVLPFTYQIRSAFVTKYESKIRAHLPIQKNFHDRVTSLTEPSQLEFFDLHRILKLDIPQRELALLKECSTLRRGMAHADPQSPDSIVKASELWEDVSLTFPTECLGWDWPRCGQKLILLVGPSGAGKTTIAAQRYDAADIISSDAIRESLTGDIDMAGGQNDVFVRVRQRIERRLAAGQMAVLDAINLRKEDRLASILLAPSDTPIEYVIVDRTMEQKIAAAGHRLAKPHLLETHAKLFADELDDILAGDGFPNVSVIDTRMDDCRSPAD